MKDGFFRDENFWLYVPLIMWIGGILYLSSSKGSFSHTLPYFAPFLKFLFPRDDPETLEYYYGIVRKICHFVGYAILALLASVVFYNSFLLSPARFWYFYAFVIVLVVASVDEIRQCFYPDRSGSLSDIALDCVGGLTMILLFWVLASNIF